MKPRSIPDNYDDQWLEVAHFMPDPNEVVLLAWVKDNGLQPTMRTGRWSDRLLRFVSTSDAEFRTQPNYFRNLPLFL